MGYSYDLHGEALRVVQFPGGAGLKYLETEKCFYLRSGCGFR
jgi:hypothetical protein